MSSNREALRKAIAARKEARQTEAAAKWEKLRAASKAPDKFAATLQTLVVKSARQADSWENLRDNLNLVKAAKEMPAKLRIATARNYAKGFVRYAAENPELLADALREAYKGLDEQAAAIEMAAQELGVDLASTAVEEAFADEGKMELEHGEAEGEEMMEGEAAPDFEESEEKEEEEVKEASGSDFFVTDRDKGGKPSAPAKADIPQAQGKSEVGKSSAKVTPAGQRVASGNL